MRQQPQVTKIPTNTANESTIGSTNPFHCPKTEVIQPSSGLSIPESTLFWPLSLWSLLSAGAAISSSAILLSSAFWVDYQSARGRGADLWSCGGDGCLRRSVCLCFSGLFLLTAAGVCVLLLSSLAVPTDGPPLLPCESVLRLVCHLVVFCPYCISTGLLLSICCSRKTPIKLAISMEMTQHRRGQELDGDYDDITADVTTEHAL
ncbi:unnamed protein product [Oreochromis niloticus]|nr:unnamed protein product [Mustela putorius furo]CAI5657599.1 unnamed protein product [Mustela putorius furo]